MSYVLVKNTYIRLFALNFLHAKTEFVQSVLWGSWKITDWVVNKCEFTTVKHVLWVAKIGLLFLKVQYETCQNILVTTDTGRKQRKNV